MPTASPPSPPASHLPTIVAALGHAIITTTAVYTTAAGLEAREFLARMWAQEPNSPGSCA